MSSFQHTEIFVDFDYALWKAIDELHQFKEEPKDAFFHMSFIKKVEHMDCSGETLPTLINSTEIPCVPSATFHVRLHDLLYPDSAQRCIHKILRQMLYLDPVMFQDLKNRISLFASTKAREAYTIGCNTLSIISSVELLVTHFYMDEDEKYEGARELNKEVNASSPGILLL